MKLGSRRIARLREIDRLRAELRAKDGELRELRDQLRAIHASDAWAILRTLGQLRHALAPHGTRRDRLLRSSVRGLRRFKKLAMRLPHAPETAMRSFRAGARGRPRVDPATRENPAIICLPIIEWHFRFQRPQQLMRQFARASHLVLYAANRFHGGAAARTHPIESNVLEMVLPGDPAANIYQHSLARDDCARMLAAMERLGADLGLSDAVVVAQHPYWTPLAESLRARFGWPIVYDCMDDHAGFFQNGAEVLETERRLVAAADLVVASSRRLYEAIRARSRSATLIRNACEYEHFCREDARPPSRRDHPTIGYYGAIAEWFDSELVAKLAALRPEWRFELIGSTLAGNIRPLEGLPNIRLLGECPYAELPGRLDGWDAFIIPFRRQPLTEATNPVKVYEMLATGKPVVAVGLPELVPIARRGLIRLAATAERFAAAIERALRDDEPPSRDRRRAFARANTWSVRHRKLAEAIAVVRRRPDSQPHEPAGPSGKAVGAAAC
jgi:glycosyltransferase involved in cell wall biosynthesis